MEGDAGMTPEFCVSCTVLDAPLIARVQMLDGGVRAEIYGGTRPHIVAVSIAGPEGSVTTTEFPTHRDGAGSFALCQEVGLAVAQRGVVRASGFDVPI